ncbi:MAG: choice-of-anchor D domain-containing protein [Solirubrobacterales bacterium]
MGLLAALMLAVPAGAAACGEEGGEDTGPLVKEAKLTPSSLPSDGGTGVISARVEDDCGVAQVYAEITTTEAGVYSFQMLPFEDINSNARVYRAEFQVPANYQEWEVGYQANVSAEDTNGAYAEAYAGEISVAGAPQFDEPPYISAATATPSIWGAWGGATKISVEASDTRSLANVYAIVNGPDGSETELPLEAVSFSRFEGVLNVPANFGPLAENYSISAFAEDDIGQTTGAFAGAVTVEPKGTPHPGALTLEPGALHFGPVSLGHPASQTIALANTGKPGSPPVTGSLKVPGSQYSLVGASGESLPFSIGPGEKETFTVRFQPSDKGQQTARLALVRTDGRQPNRGVSLFGWGVK